MTIRLQDGDPAALSLDQAIAAARRPTQGCEAVRSIKLVIKPPDDGSPLALDPAFEYRDAIMTAVVAPQPRKATAGTAAPVPPPLVLSPSIRRPQPQGVGAADDNNAPLSPLFGRRVAISSISASGSPSPSRLGRPDNNMLLPPPPILPPPPPAAFDRVALSSSSGSPLPSSPARGLQQAQPQPQPQQPQRLTLATVLTEDLSLTFLSAAASDIQVGLEGYLQLGLVTHTHSGAAATAAMSTGGAPLEFEVALADKAEQVVATKPNPSLLSLVSSNNDKGDDDLDTLFPPFIPESAAQQRQQPQPPTDGGEPCVSSSYRCRIPADRVPQAGPTTPLALLRFEAKPHVRPVPVRIQQSLLRVDAPSGIAHVVAQLVVNPSLYMPLVSASLALQLPSELAFGQVYTHVRYLSCTIVCPSFNTTTTSQIPPGRPSSPPPPLPASATSRRSCSGRCPRSSNRGQRCCSRPRFHF